MCSVIYFAFYNNYSVYHNLKFELQLYAGNDMGGKINYDTFTAKIEYDTLPRRKGIFCKENIFLKYLNFYIIRLVFLAS